jgi:hypothetical protein
MLLKTENLTGILAKDLMSANPKTVEKMHLQKKR